MLKTFTARLDDDAACDVTPSARKAIGCVVIIAVGVAGSANKPSAGVAGVGRLPSVAGLHPLLYALVTVFLVWSSATHASGGSTVQSTDDARDENPSAIGLDKVQGGATAAQQ